MYSYVVSMIDENFKMVTILDFASIRTEVVLAFIAIGVVTGIIGSTISTRKYLKA